MRKITWTLDTGFSGAKHEGELEVEDETTDDEIEELVRAEVDDCLDWWWEEVSG